mmetsp:Transcript_16300/g.33097  ORF Transcript_16300/g.33097 Transcript_16300/m.33097 type:complete len:355 (-) Transcript_16300:2329-3393(-)
MAEEDEISSVGGTGMTEGEMSIDSGGGGVVEETAPTLFDPSSKKKKKKKAKVELGADGDGTDGLDGGITTFAGGDEDGVTFGVEGAGGVGGLEGGAGAGTGEGQDGDGVAGSSGGVDLDGAGDGGMEDAAAAIGTVDFPLLDFEKKKKKRKKKVVEFDEDDDDGDLFTDDTLSRGIETKVNVKHDAPKLPWEGSERDYTYQEMIQRAFVLLHGKNPDLVGEGRKRLTLRAPQVAKEGSKKTVFLNYGEICKSLHRQPDHLLMYMSAELGTTGNLQAGGSLVIKGNFKPKGIERVLRTYISEYVTCSSCKSPDTVLMRDPNTRLYFLQCESCGAKRSVAPIRQGYMAQVERRKRN